MRLSLYECPGGASAESGNVVTYDLAANTAHYGACTVAGPALQWRLEPAGDGAGAALSEEIDLPGPPGGPIFLRADRIDFPPGGIAYTHTHPGPGIRRIILGTVDIRDGPAGPATRFAEGGCWFEDGPSPVHATASEIEPSAFVRVLMLPAEWAGKRTIKYVDPEDENKPKLQTPTVFFDQRAVAPTQQRMGGGIQLVWGIASLDQTDDEPTDVVVAGLKRLAESGLLEVDTARIYGEDMFCRGVSALRLGGSAELAESLVVNTKASVRTQRADTILTYEGVLGQLELSLVALGRDRANIFYLHQPDTRALLDDSLRACNELHLQGKFSELGLSNFPAWQVTQIYYKCREEGWVLPTVFQGRYNPLFRQPEDELIPALRMLGMRLHCYSPLEGGLLGDTASPRGNPLSSRLDGQPGLASAVADIETACKSAGLSKQQTTMRWFFHHSALQPGDAIIVGASNLPQLVANLDELDAEHGPLPEGVAAAVDASWESWCAAGPERRPHSIDHMEVSKL